MKENTFVKTHGLGNEYIVLDSDNISFQLTEKAIKRICNVNFGIGSDGILLKVPSDKADFGLRIYNPDGSEAEKSGNGLRIFCKYIYDYNFTESKAVEKVTKAYKEEQNPVEAYLNEVLVYEEGSSETKKAVLDAYKSWIEGEGISSRGTDSPQRFWRALNNSTKINLNCELTYKKIAGTLYLRDFKIDYSKLPKQEVKYTFSN